MPVRHQQYTPTAQGRKRRANGSFYGPAGLGLAALLSVWTYTTHANPTLKIPQPKLPTPNAFDAYLAAANAMVPSQDLMDAIATHPSGHHSPAQKEAILRQNRNAIEQMQVGLTYSYLNPPLRSLSTETKYYSKFRAMAFLLALQGQVRGEEGDWSGAATSDLDTICMGEEIPHGSPILGALVGYSFQAIGRREMGKVVDHLDAAQSQAAIDRLTRLMKRHVPFADTLQEEKWMVQAEMMELFTGTLKPDPEDAEDAKRETKPPKGASMADLLYYVKSKKRIMHDFTVYMDQSSQQARQPYSLHLQPHEPTDSINRIMLPVFMNARLRDVKNETQNALLLVTLALHTYHLEHKRYPGSLAELTPAYLTNLPQDPFIGQGTVRYRLQGDRYILYSVGPDGKDDGGAPIDDPKRIVGSQTEARYEVFDDSVGDVVAGKNSTLTGWMRAYHLNS